MTSIDVVIPAYNGWNLTQSCLSHLHVQTVPHTVVVVDNGSTDGTPDRLRASFPGVRIVELGSNFGFAVACNRGVVSGSGEVVVLLNNDVEARSDFLECLVRPLANPAVGSVAARLVRPGEAIIDCVGLTVDWTLAGYPRLRGRPVAEAAAEEPVLAGPSGGGGAYRRTAWEEVGGLDEGVVGYGEDVDLALRLSRAGWKAATAPTAVCVHLGSASFGHRSAWQRYQGGFSRGYFMRRYGVLRTRAGARALATEGFVVAGDAVLSRDLSALRGRIDGWRSARELERRPLPPRDAIDESIGFRESLRLRRDTYAG